MILFADSIKLNAANVKFWYLIDQSNWRGRLSVSDLLIFGIWFTTASYLLFLKNTLWAHYIHCLWPPTSIEGDRTVKPMKSRQVTSVPHEVEETSCPSASHNLNLRWFHELSMKCAPSYHGCKSNLKSFPELKDKAFISCQVCELCLTPLWLRRL